MLLLHAFFIVLL